MMNVAAAEAMKGMPRYESLRWHHYPNDATDDNQRKLN
jgi:hypothetical protein